MIKSEKALKNKKFSIKNGDEDENTTLKEYCFQHNILIE